MSDNLAYHQHLDEVARADLAYVRNKDAQYDASWKRRGGEGAFFTIVRPWDRLENFARQRGFDLFEMITDEGLDGPDGSVIACVRDLRRYLLLVEAECMQRLGLQAAPLPDDDRADLHALALAVQPLDALQPRERAVLDGLPGTPCDGGHHEASSAVEIAKDAEAYMDDQIAQALAMKIPERDWTESMRQRMADRVLEAAPRQATTHFQPPWVIGWKSVQDYGIEAMEAYSRHGNGVFVIEPSVTTALHAILPAAVRDLYRPVYAGPSNGTEAPDYRDEPMRPDDAPLRYWLDVSRCPAGERERWRTVPAEQNLNEAADLVEWIELYQWDQSRLRYMVRPQHRAWMQEL